MDNAASVMFGSQVTVSIIAAWALEQLKQTKWFPPLSDRSAYMVQRFWAVVVAGLTALGITWTLDGDVSSGWTIALVVPPLAHFGHLMWQWLVSFVWQEIGYQKLVKPNGK